MSARTFTAKVGRAEEDELAEAALPLVWVLAWAAMARDCVVDGQESQECGTRAGQTTRLTEHRSPEFAHVAVARNRATPKATTHNFIRVQCTLSRRLDLGA